MVYTDGSYRKERAAGTYAWIAGWHDVTGNLGVLMHGGGKECDGDNPARGRINSTRMEAMAMIRARQIVRKYWDSQVIHHMDNQSAIARDKHSRRETPRERWRAPDSDIWSLANDQRPDHAWTTRWVKAHADDDKQEHELTNEERGNVAADKLAETQYDAPLHIERPWATTREGTVILETNIREYHAVTGDNTKTILKHIRRLNTRMALDKELTKIVGHGHDGVTFQSLDMDLQEDIEAVDKKKGLTVAHMKLTAGILATNDRLATYSETDAKCPCCGARNETQNHLLGHCPHKELVKQRQKLIKEVHKAVGETIGRHVSDKELELIQQIWTHKSLKGVAGQSATHEHEVYDWSDVKDDKLMRYMTRLTEPGATKMWDGWFTTYWRPILTDMIQRQQPNRSAARAYDIATKAAKNIRLTIKTGLHDMWKIRNEIKFDRQTKETWTDENIKQVVEDYEKHTGQTEKFSLREIGAWRQRKINKWATLRKQATRTAITRHERNKAALRKFNDKWQLFKNLPFQADSQTYHDHATTPRRDQTRTAPEKPQTDHDPTGRDIRSHRSPRTSTEGLARPTQGNSPATANDGTETPNKDESDRQQQQHIRLERQSTKHWDAITRQWQRGPLKKRTRTEDAPGANRHKQSVTSQPKITRFLTTTRRTVDHKRGDKRKRDAEPRSQQDHRPTQVRDDNADKEPDVEAEEAPVTRNAKRQKIDRTSIG